MDMENAGWMLVVLLASQLVVASSQDTTGWINIDCGIDDFSRFDDNLIIWDADDDYIKTGENKRVTQNQPLEEMRTLRAFPDKKQKQHCYSIPVYKQTFRYLVRAGFFYGNYDGLSKPPTFDLYVDGEKWATVDTVSNGEEPLYHEVMYVTQGSGLLNLCLVQTRKGDVPFISSIEAVPLTFSLYPTMETTATFHLLTRTNFGGNEIRYEGLGSDEMYNRIWTSGDTPSNCADVGSSSDFDKLENDPPDSLFSDSIQPNVTSESIILTVDHPQLTPQAAYFVFYLSGLDDQQDPNDTMIMQIYINGQYEQTVASLDPYTCKVEIIYPVMVGGPKINITLSPTDESTLPPWIAGMEVFAKQAHGSEGTRKHICFACLFVQLVSLVLLLLA